MQEGFLHTARIRGGFACSQSQAMVRTLIQSMQDQNGKGWMSEGHGTSSLLLRGTPVHQAW